MANQQFDNAAVEAGVQSLNYVQLLTLYHQIQNTGGDNYSSQLTKAVTSRAEHILDNDDRIDNLEDGTEVHATDFLYGSLNETGVANSQEYNKTIADALNTVASNMEQAQNDLTWYRENYAKAKDEFEEAAATFAKETGTDEVSFEQAMTYSEEGANWQTNLSKTLKEKYADDTSNDTVDATKMSDKAQEALATMKEIVEELEIHSTIGNDKIIQNAGMSLYNDYEVDSYRGSSTNGKSDDLEGIGEDNIGTGVGKGGNGTGNGTGNGSGDGDGDDAKTALEKAKTSKSGDIDVDSIFSKTANNDNTADDIAKYMEAMSNEPQINHIFSNTFYGTNAVPEWSFSVDFIPCTKTITSFVNLDELELLTKAIQTISANEKSVNIQKLNYLGLSHPFFTKMKQTHGDLNITFAENEEYQVTKLLIKLLKYGSFVPSFPTYEIVDVVDTTAMRKAILNNDDLVVTYAPSDDESPAYKLNAAVLSTYGTGEIPDAKFSELSNTNKYLFDVVLKLYRACDAHAFGDSKDNQPQYVYHYHKCWIKNLGSIELNYDNDDMINREVIFSYQYLTTSTYDEYLAKNLAQPKELSQKEMIKYFDNIKEADLLPALVEDINNVKN